jgi:putative endonuclease
VRITNPIGKKGEDIAVEYLKKKGYKVIERNFRKGYGEIDIVAIKNNVLVFVEVKTRTSETFGTPFESITSWKLKPLIKTAQYYSMIHPELPNELRIDAISVVLEGLKESIEHLENISGF